MSGIWMWGIPAESLDVRDRGGGGGGGVEGKKKGKGEGLWFGD